MRPTAFVIAWLAIMVAMPAYAQNEAKLQLYPTRIFLDEKDNTAELSVINGGTATGRFRISVADMQMPENGALERIEDDNLPYSLAPYLRVTPRSVEVPPAQSQKFRMLVRPPRDLEDGEYRTHLHVLTSSDNVEHERADRGVGIKMRPRKRVSIPAIYLKGETWFKNTIEKMEWVRHGGEGLSPIINLYFTNEGNRSALGDLVITLRKGDQVHEVSRSNGFTIYRGTERRVHDAVIELPEGVSLQGGLLRVVFYHTRENGGGIITEKEWQL